MKVTTNREEYQTELQDLCKLFGTYDDISINHIEQSAGENYMDKFELERGMEKKTFAYSYRLDQTLSPLRQKSYRKRMVKNHLYSLHMKHI